MPSAIEVVCAQKIIEGEGLGFERAVAQEEAMLKERRIPYTSLQLITTAYGLHAKRFQLLSPPEGASYEIPSDYQHFQLGNETKSVRKPSLFRKLFPLLHNYKR